MVGMELQTMYWVVMVFHHWSKQHPHWPCGNYIVHPDAESMLPESEYVGKDKTSLKRLKQELNFCNRNASHKLNGKAQLCGLKSAQSSRPSGGPPYPWRSFFGGDRCLDCWVSLEGSCCPWVNTPTFKEVLLDIHFLDIPESLWKAFLITSLSKLG